MFWFCLLVAPLLIWSLTATTLRVWMPGFAVLAAVAASQYVVGRRWVFPDGQFTVLAALTLITAAVLVFGPFLERGESRSTLWRSRIGYGLGFVAGLIAVSWIVLFGPVFFLMGRWSFVPAPTALDPLPAGLSVRETVDKGCTSRSSDSDCARRFVLTGAEAPEHLAAQLRGHLTDTRACAFERKEAQGRQYWWGTCPMAGWPLDRHETTAAISAGADTVILDLAYLDDW
ncbi:hypothetical protein [Nocardia asteroides]|uniref:hypothetical protein n=1 Tax=Nocardia asteroides TaxID=1824 RepID=UPI001E5F84A8|nr:hypothetical protein [Nocardia asteroides]UGT58181.1 hypothetical protein LTT85_15660 [Nocardia asteroides]